MNFLLKIHFHGYIQLKVHNGIPKFKVVSPGCTFLLCNLSVFGMRLSGRRGQYFVGVFLQPIHNYF